MNKEKEDSEDFGFNIDYHKEDKSTDNIDDLEEDIPYSENWKRISLDKMKKDFNSWLDFHVEKEFLKDFIELILIKVEMQVVLV